MNVPLSQIKGFVALGMMVIGLSVSIFLGILPMVTGVSKEPLVIQSFSLKAINGDYIGYVLVELRPSEAFVVYDEVSVLVYAYLNSSWVDNGSARVEFRFTNPQIDAELDSELNESTHPIMYSWNGRIRCYNEGALDAHLYVISSQSEEVARDYETNENAKDFAFSNILPIKPYTYLEQRRNAHLTKTLAFVVLGLSIISTIPAADRAIDAFVNSRLL